MLSVGSDLDVNDKCRYGSPLVTNRSFRTELRYRLCEKWRFDEESLMGCEEDLVFAFADEELYNR